MKCVYHSDREAEFICSSCGQPICRECATVIDGRNLCRACAYRSTQYMRKRPGANDGINSFLFFIYLAVPGIRHMYLGFMKRGLDFLAAFFGLICLSTIFNENIFLPVIFIIWFYSAFDSYQIRKLTARGEKVEDTGIFKGMGLESIKDFFMRKRTFSGAMIIVLGVYLLLKDVVRHRYMLLPSGVITIFNFVIDSTIPIAMIVGGVYILSKAGKTKHQDAE